VNSVLNDHRLAWATDFLLVCQCIGRRRVLRTGVCHGPTGGWCHWPTAGQRGPEPSMQASSCARLSQIGVECRGGWPVLGRWRRCYRFGI